MPFAPPVLELSVKSVLLATDLSPTSAKPLQQALAIARHYQAKLYVAHVVSSVPYLMAGSEALQLGCEGASHDMHELMRDLLHDGSLDGLDYEFIVQCGGVWKELQAAISGQQIDLVVVGTHARRGFEKMLLGSVAEEVFRHADCPVLTVGPHSYREGRIGLNGESRSYVFATDFSDASLAALPHAVSLARRTKARLILVHVVPAPSVPQISGWHSRAEITAMRENARMACVRRLEHLLPRDEEAPIEREFIVHFGAPSEKILDTALNSGAELIILGLHRPSLASPVSHLPGATAYEVVCGAGCPVLTVRE